MGGVCEQHGGEKQNLRCSQLVLVYPPYIGVLSVKIGENVFLKG